MLDNEQMPFTGNSFQVMLPAINEAQTGTGYQILNGAGDQNLARPGASAITRAPICTAMPLILSCPYFL